MSKENRVKSSYLHIRITEKLKTIAKELKKMNGGQWATSLMN